MTWKVKVPHATMNNLRLLMNSWADVSHIYAHLPNTLAAYYTALEEAGNPIGRFAHSIETRSPTTPTETAAKQDKIRDLGQDAAKFANFMRIADFEKSRLSPTSFWKNYYASLFPSPAPQLPSNPAIRSLDKPIPGGAGGIQRTDMWNAAATLNSVPAADRPAFRQNLIDLHNWLMNPATAPAGSAIDTIIAGHYRDHIGALDGIAAAAQNARCPVAQIDKHPAKRSSTLFLRLQSLRDKSVLQQNQSIRIQKKHQIAITGILRILMNPALKTDCFGANPGWGYCTHVPDAAGTTTTTTSFSSIVSTTTTQKPTTTSTTTKLTTVTTTTKTTTTITKATTTTTTSKTTTTSALPDPTFLPDQFPPKKGQAAQCVPEFPDDRFPNGNLQPYMIWGDELTEGVQQACTKLLPGGSKWLEKGDPYTVTVPVLRRTMCFYGNKG
ncbi:hypothetical protein Dda_2209 [Drechslerella dactyloides]|uniref:Uncharacterized protein n=1 Tax=Drechslerella dactyloides TaxID=74499 RepID=A0AAD6J765_DREDA|nr:hypothetical protein Dda_2209 [Drechslerella dactyloides]